MNDLVQTLIGFFILLTVGSLIQLCWTRGIAHRVEAWMSDPNAAVDRGAFAKISGLAVLGWLGMALVGAIVVVSFVLSGNGPSNNQEEVCFGLSVGFTIWSLVMVVFSLLSLRACAAMEQFAALRDFDHGDGVPTELAQLLPAPVTTIRVSGGTVRRRWENLRAISTFCLSAALLMTLSGVLTVAAEELGGVGTIILLSALILIPGVFALLFARWAVKAKSQRAQFLWFLALTVQKQRSLAPELRQWAEAHPGRFGSRVLEAAHCLAAGDSLSAAFAGRDLVAATDLLSIRVGEPTGRLAEALREAAVRQTNTLNRDAMNVASSGPVLYLGMLMLVAINIVTFLVMFIVPKFKVIFMGFGTELPWITVALINIADILARYFFLFVWIPMLVLLLMWTCGEAYFKGWSETWLAWFTGFGRQAEIPRLLRRLREAVAANVPWDQALRPMVLHHHREPIRWRLERVLGRVTAGMSLWPALRDSGLLTTRDVALLEMAERANNLSWTLTALAEAKERSLAHRWQMALTLLAPLGILAGGFCVFFICVGFFMPLVKLLNDLS